MIPRLLGHEDLTTAMIYTHAINHGAFVVSTPSTRHAATPISAAHLEYATQIPEPCRKTSLLRDPPL